MFSIEEVVRCRVVKSGARLIFTGDCLGCSKFIYKPNNPYWKGYKVKGFCTGGCANRKDGLDSGGYVCRSVGRKRILEHREKMEKKLGRKLGKHETVHHINGIRSDNRLSNLELWATRQPYGQRVEDLVRFVAKHYRKEVLKEIRTNAKS